MGKIGRVERYIFETLERKGAMLFALVDPVDYRSAEIAAKTAINAAESGADAILVGGSIGAQGGLLDDVCKSVKDRVGSIPVVLFPGNIATITGYADAVYFMSLLNARNPYWITQAQMLSAPLVKHLKIEPLPVGYIVVAPGGTVGWVGDANIIPREKPRIAAALALAGEYLGNRFIITDAGSNPSLQGAGHVPIRMIREVRAAISVPYIVAGGVNDIKSLKDVYSAGADIVQVGTALEGARPVSRVVSSFARVAKELGRKRISGR
jgi:phosphoglycerol geranylgeranyltransferase